MTADYILKCRSLFDRVTPLFHRDCGELCGGACCKGDENACVFLFPGERELLEGKGFEFRKTQGNSGFDALVCGGSCDRRHRPLGCMIFPLFPYAVEVSDGVKIIPVTDPRAHSVCPIASSTRELSVGFVKAVRRTGEYMLLDNTLKTYLLEVSSQLREIAQLGELFNN